MADEPAVPTSRVSDAHDENGGQVEPSCFIQSEPGGETILPDDRNIYIYPGTTVLDSHCSVECAVSGCMSPTLISLCMLTLDLD